MELAHQRGTQPDEHGAQDYDAQNAPEKHLVLILARHAQQGEDRGDQKDVVERERLFNRIAGQKGHGALDAEMPTQPHGEQQRDTHVAC